MDGISDGVAENFTDGSSDGARDGFADIANDGMVDGVTLTILVGTELGALGGIVRLSLGS